MNTTNKLDISKRQEDIDSLFNFRWKKTMLDKLRTLAAKRGVTASSIVKNMLLQEFDKEEAKLGQYEGVVR